MKKCEKCQKEYEDTLETCPYCSPESMFNANENEEGETSLFELQTNDQPTEGKIATLPKIFCKYCGNEIVDGNDYCNHCGHDIYDKDKRHCINCGNLLEPKQTFCDKCGHKATSINLPPKIVNAKNHFSKKKMIIAIIAALFAVGLVVTGIKIVPNLFVKYDTYLAEGDFEKAYDKAGNDEKDLVIKENIAAIVSSLIKENLKDSSSFVLREVYIEEKLKNVVIKEQGNNSYGGAVTSYVWYQWNNEKSEFRSYGSCSDFDKEEIKSWDDTDDMIDKLTENIVKDFVKDFIDQKKLKMESSAVNRINDLNKNGKLEDIKLLDQAKKILDKKDDDSKS